MVPGPSLQYGHSDVLVILFYMAMHLLQNNVSHAWHYVGSYTTLWQIMQVNIAFISLS
jgi:hypothetical protein